MLRRVQENKNVWFKNDTKDSMNLFLKYAVCISNTYIFIFELTQDIWKNKNLFAFREPEKTTYLTLIINKNQK